MHTDTKTENLKRRPTAPGNTHLNKKNDQPQRDLPETAVGPPKNMADATAWQPPRHMKHNLVRALPHLETTQASKKFSVPWHTSR
jgi:hypothetical protein